MVQVYLRRRLSVGLIDHNNKITKVLPKLGQSFTKAKLKLYQIFSKYVKKQKIFYIQGTLKQIKSQTFTKLCQSFHKHLHIINQEHVICTLN